MWILLSFNVVILSDLTAESSFRFELDRSGPFWPILHISTSNFHLSSSFPPLLSVLSILPQSFSHPTSNETQSACSSSADGTQVDLSTPVSVFTYLSFSYLVEHQGSSCAELLERQYKLDWKHKISKKERKEKTVNYYYFSEGDENENFLQVWSVNAAFN